MHPFLLGLLNEWEVELQHLNPNRVLHIAGFVTLCEGFLGIDPHANLFRTFSYVRALSLKGEGKLAPVGGFGLQKRGGRSGDYPAYTLTESNRGWHEKWFYFRNLAEKPFQAFTGAHPEKKDSWTWRAPTAEKQRVGVLEKALRKRVMEEGLDGVRLFGTILSHQVVPLADRTTRMWEYTGLADPDQASACPSPRVPLSPADCRSPKSTPAWPLPLSSSTTDTSIASCNMAEKDLNQEISNWVATNTGSDESLKDVGADDDAEKEKLFKNSRTKPLLMHMLHRRKSKAAKKDGYIHQHQLTAKQDKLILKGKQEQELV
ncbi:hypothetical protein C2845_PM05G20460 [Panicum miliaceum]|uniref:Transposase (putative) gypsy type domain-containing protein n=1 Tax=Panicum miliaceum TaxID=4540 RepID=A0A3L6SUU2_PANMI|nr:hypothetical protein C2845_PM05G20460 [Panicum miliaceum]